MGNVFATSANPPPIAPNSFSNFVPQEETGKVIPPDQENVSRLGDNPGSIEDLHRKCKGTFDLLNLSVKSNQLFSTDVFPIPFDGTKVVITRALSNHFQVNHNIVMGGGVTPPGYRFGATYIGTNQLSQTEAYPIFFGEIDPSGNLNSRIIHFIGERIKVNLAAHFKSSKCIVSQFQSEYLGSNFTGSLTLGNIDPVRNSGLVVTSYLHNITKKFALGAELLTRYSSSTLNSNLSLAGRYNFSDCVVSGTLNTTGAQLCYYQKKNENLQVNSSSSV